MCINEIGTHALCIHVATRNQIFFSFRRDIEKVEEAEETSESLLLIDTAGCQLYELDVPEEISKGNEGYLVILIYELYIFVIM